jgi:hypothetical protein
MKHLPYICSAFFLRGVVYTPEREAIADSVESLVKREEDELFADGFQAESG